MDDASQVNDPFAPPPPQDRPIVAQPAPEQDPFVPPQPVGIPPERRMELREEAVARREKALDDRARLMTEAAQINDKTVEGQIVAEYSVCAWDAYANQHNITPDAERALRCITMTVLVLRNGFAIVGTNACAAPENYNATDGGKAARADAIDKLWLCEEYAARNRLMGLDRVEPLVYDEAVTDPYAPPVRQ